MTTPSHKPMSAPHARRRQELQLQRHATAIQAAFRGWCTRKRVVWEVREELDVFVADMQRDMHVAQMLLGAVALPPRIAAARWLVEGERRCHLHLPRMDDSVFGVTFPFPPLVALDLTDGVFSRTAVETAPPSSNGETSSQDDEGQAAEDPLQAPVTAVNPLDTSVYPIEERAIESDEHAAAADSVSGSKDATTNEHAALSEKVVEVVREHTDAEDTLPEPTSTEELNVSNSEIPARLDTHPTNLLSVEAILATHSRDEILRELEWVRQALRDRRKVHDQRFPILYTF